MGVPSFFRWLMERYPRVIEPCEEALPEMEGDKVIPVDTSLPNPNGVEYDNLYLDMNGLIHPCFHPDGAKPPSTEAELFDEVFHYIDRLFSIVRPRNCIFMALDGVAPRAKMNQQRSRRYRSGFTRDYTAWRKDQCPEEEAEEDPTASAEPLPDWLRDSNVITPGTPFMHRLSVAIRYYIRDRLTNDPGWRNISVYFSDSNAPGEGEHKIINFVRRCRAQDGYNPCTRHCIYGLDADLILLALGTHEPRFTILRELVFDRGKRICRNCGQVGHLDEQCRLVLPAAISGRAPLARQKAFQFLQVETLREYLAHEFQPPPNVKLAFKHDLERIIDDFVLLSFLCGNDFLPHLPSLEIRESAVVRLISFYKRALSRSSGYLIEDGVVNFKRFDAIFNFLAQEETSIFARRARKEQEFQRRISGRNKRIRQQIREQMRQEERVEKDEFEKEFEKRAERAGAFSYREKLTIHAREVTKYRREILGAKRAAASAQDEGAAVPSAEHPPVEELVACLEHEKPRPITCRYILTDSVNLHTRGYRERFYRHKHKAAINPKATSESGSPYLSQLVAEYCKGIQWVASYYTAGCVDWSWYFPYHFPPLTCDLPNAHRVLARLLPVKEGRPRIERFGFNLGSTPFLPYEQLLSVLPPASSVISLPRPLAGLAVHRASPLLGFYPQDFTIDMDGKSAEWLGVALLPFINGDRLQAVARSVTAASVAKGLLSAEELERNTLQETLLFLHEQNPCAAAAAACDGAALPAPVFGATAENARSIGAAGAALRLAALLGEEGASAFDAFELKRCAAVSAVYHFPAVPDDFVQATLLAGAAPEKERVSLEEWTKSSRARQNQNNEAFGRNDGRRAASHGRGGPPSMPAHRLPPRAITPPARKRPDEVFSLAQFRKQGGK